nr:unnamed protein product [Callosobruchus chinensis]
MISTDTSSTPASRRKNELLQLLQSTVAGAPFRSRRKRRRLSTTTGTTSYLPLTPDTPFSMPLTHPLPSPKRAASPQQVAGVSRVLFPGR